MTPFEYSVDQRGVVWYGDGATVTEAHGQGDEARRLRGMIRLRTWRANSNGSNSTPPTWTTRRGDQTQELDQAYDRFTASSDA
ncbi:MAG: hypothetical protein ACLS6O_00165 [Bifidobacterium sp.]